MQITLIVSCLCGALAAQAADESWKQPLAEKAVLIEQNCAERHNILGLYPSQVEVPLDGTPVDNTTLGIGNIAHPTRRVFWRRAGACRKSPIFP